LAFAAYANLLCKEKTSFAMTMCYNDIAEKFGIIGRESRIIETRHKAKEST